MAMRGRLVRLRVRPIRAASCSGDLDEAVLLARQAGQIPDIPGTAGRLCGFLLAATLTEAGDLAAAGQACAATLAWARDYDEIAPVRGITVGGAGQWLQEAVDVVALSGAEL